MSALLARRIYLTQSDAATIGPCHYHTVEALAQPGGYNTVGYVLETVAEDKFSTLVAAITERLDYEDTPEQAVAAIRELLLTDGEWS